MRRAELSSMEKYFSVKNIFTSDITVTATTVGVRVPLPVRGDPLYGDLRAGHHAAGHEISRYV